MSRGLIATWNYTLIVDLNFKKVESGPSAQMWTPNRLFAVELLPKAKIFSVQVSLSSN